MWSDSNCPRGFLEKLFSKLYIEVTPCGVTSNLNLLNEIIEIGQVESGRLPIYTKKFNVRKIIDDIVALVKPSLTDKKLKLQIKFDQSISYNLIGDPIRLHRIILNLVSNAIKFTDKGQVSITVELLKKLDGPVILQFKIEDTGIGIPSDKQDIIFSRFSRLTSSYEGTYKGTGLGLTIVKQFIDDLQGEVYVKSQIAKDSCFTCVIPFKQQ